jgi:segregation and condensation protein B
MEEQTEQTEQSKQVEESEQIERPEEIELSEEIEQPEEIELSEEIEQPEQIELSEETERLEEIELPEQIEKIEEVDEQPSVENISVETKNTEVMSVDDEMNIGVDIPSPSFEEMIEEVLVAGESEVEVEVEAEAVSKVEGEKGFSLELNHFDQEEQEDRLWMARTGLNIDTLCGAIETVIFMSEKPISLIKIKNLIDEDLPLRVIHQSLTRLQEEYEQKHHGLRLVEVADGYQYRTKATFSKYVQDLFKVNQLVLSPTALEVLAIIAYKQPASKIEVDKIRGVDSGHIVRSLMDKRLVKVAGRSDEMGRPVLYGTTPEFLEVFNLANIDELPPEHELEDLVEDGIGKLGDIKTIVQSGDKERFVFDEIDELDDLAEAIKTISSDTDFTKSLKSEEKKKTNVSENGGGPSTPKKTAFELLEEYVQRKQIIDINKESLESELISTSVDPQVISDLTAGPFNCPEEEEEEEEFQMIDLDTGLPIEDEIEGEVEDVGPFASEETEEASTNLLDEVEAIELLKDSDEEAQELSRALDEAFENLTGEKLDDELEGELDLDTSSLNEQEDDLEKLSEQIVQQANELDLDLNFLQENEDNSTPSEKPE